MWRSDEDTMCEISHRCLQAMAESVAKMHTQHGLTPDFALIDGPYAPPALKQNPDVEV